MSFELSNLAVKDVTATLASVFPAPAVEGTFPLSPTQAGMLFHSLLAPDAGIYLEQIILRLEGELDVRLFQNAWQKVVDHHEILRTSFSWEGQERPVQIVHRQVTMPFQILDWRELGQSDQASRLESFVRTDRISGFDFTAPPLMRIAVVRLADDAYLLIWTNHHALLDGWSQSLLLKQVFTVYGALSSGSEPVLEPSPSYRNYVNWLAAQDSSESERFWKETLKGFAAPTSLAIDRLTTDSLREVVKHAESELQLSSADTAELQAFARKHRITMFTLVQGAWALLLARYSGTDDVVFGSTVSMRPHELPDVESAVGLFISTIPVRVRLGAETDLISWLKELQLDAVEAREHQHTSLVDIQRWSEAPNGLSLFDSILVFENYPAEDDDGDSGRSVDMHRERSFLSRTNYPLTLLAFPDKQLQLIAIYDRDRFEPESIQRLLDHLRTILGEMAANPTRRLDQFSLLTPDERRQQLVEWNRTEVEYEKELRVNQLIEQQAERSPNAVAVVFERQTLTYAELNARANQLAHHLRGLGVGPESLVGICVERSLDMIVGLLGILKAGAAYVPLDPAFPHDRLAFMIKDASVPVLITQQELANGLPPHQARLVCLDSDWDIIERESTTNPVTAAGNNDLAYVIYTSGSTGEPKGVQIGHRALTNFLCSVRREPGLNANDVLVSVTTLSFDIAALELYLPLIVGARLVIANRDTAADGHQLQERVRETGATVVQATPATWRMLIDAGWRGDKRLKVLCGGEALARDLADRLLELCGSVWNMYGPTETTIWSTVWKVEPGDGPVSIGRPLANTQIYLLDKHLSPVPIGVAGELHIGGDGLARGYLNRPELSAEKFIRNPFGSEPGSRLYKTGDLARYLPNGNIECLGRSDDQVKLRGFRIELGEIESVLRRHDQVRESVVMAREDTLGNKRLVAYVVPNFPGQLDNVELRTYLQAKLPEYMLPSAVIELAELPLTPNGKVNRRALPAPDYEAQLRDAYVPPRTPVEELLCGIWAEVLKVARVGINDNFFELGGHSLLATQVVSRVLQTFGSQLPLRALFEAPTIATFAERVHRLSNEETASTSPIARAAKQESPPLSFAQQRLWFLDQLEGQSGSYNISRAVRMVGVIDVPLLEESLSAIVARHDSLRTNFELMDGEPLQTIAAPWEMKVSLVDLRGKTEAAVRQAVVQIAECPFDLAHDRLLRASLLQLDEHDHVLLLTMHHIVSDGWSLSVLFREIGVLYEAFVTHQPSPLADLPIQYSDFALWQREWLEGEVLEKQLDYWRTQLAGAPPILEIPTDRPRPPIQTFNGANHTLVVPPSLRDSLVALSRRTDTTLFMTLLAAFQTLLSRYANQEDIVLGTPIANRTRRETEDLVGFFVNTLLMRTDLSGNPGFRELLRRVREVSLQAYAHQDVPFEKLVEELKPERNLSHMPLFQVMVVFQNEPEATLTLPALELQDFNIQSEISKFDLTLYIAESPEGLRLTFEFNTDLFNAVTIEQMGSHFATLLAAVVANPDQRLADLPLLTDSERRRLLVDWRQPQTPYPLRCIHELFAEQVSKTPDATAVVFENHPITFAELDQRANQLAHYLQKRGVGPEVIVAVCLERSIEMVIALLGVLKAGGAFVPVDPSYPAERVAFLLTDSHARIVLTQQRVRETLPVSSAEMICLDAGWGEILRESRKAPACAATPENAAYLIYTSGSTGIPKGSISPHRASINRFAWMWNRFPFAEGEVCCQKTSLSFGDSIWENFGPLLRGIPIVIIPDEMVKDPRQFVALLNTHGVTRLVLVPSLLRVILEQETNLAQALSRLKYWTCSGEALTLDLARAFKERMPDAVMINLYGSSEIAADVTCYVVDEPDQLATVPIGRPITNIESYILDQSFEPVPVGVCGELYIAGAGLARSYFDHPELTAERFLPSPFSTVPGSRMFRTGDLARYREDGTIEFLGRADYQVKIRGFRVELGDIEFALSRHRAVCESVVVAREDDSGDRRLVAYVVPVAGAKVDQKELRAFVQQKLPEYMTPSVFVELERLPLTPSGKVNRRALPAPEYTAQLTQSFEAPGTELEKLLAIIWAEVLRVTRVGINDNFFDLGGHSLLAVRLFAKIAKTLGVHLPLATLFQAPTISQLAQILREEGWTAPWSSLVPIQPQRGDRRPLFCVHAVGGNVIEYHALSRYLGPDQPFYAFQSVGLDGRQTPLRSIQEMASHYIQEMRELQPQGPYLLGGHSLGGTIAFEMACQLREQNEQVDLLALFDAYPFGYYKLQAEAQSRTYAARRFFKRMKCHLDNLRHVKGKEKFAYLMHKAQFAPIKIKQQLWRRTYRLRRFNRALPATLRNIEGLNFLAAREYVPRIYPGRVALFWATGDLTTSFDLLDGWRTLAAGGVDVHEISGNHINIIQEPHVRGLAAELKASLNQVQQTPSTTVRAA
ncbi:MAG: putative linear pentadecapeptide gramicidin synthetase LgrB [Acidobacteria bacterium]|nr:putative linear pentadecapeptide gramicidin synthetase LgrB [Acidobacteriota bacterium]